MSTKELYDLGDQPPLGEVPQKATQGSLYIRDPYALNYMYTM